MKKYRIFFDEDYCLVCDEDGYFYVGKYFYAEDEGYKTAFDEAEIVDYLTDINPAVKPNHEFVQKFIEVFGVEVEE
ncbi:hypothetical protein [Limosilactobacillus equigenerosi]|uniref:Uncharacterized protein n=1 Tax=Limosilactobacillus equigenerosi DSM 18793 = JCM 14505 TaxID=1423742 RepID=A0A0R1UIR2_9LACO|nr:hypothetical protein [Limosilactobacillus equigenerosi]KRL93264.1 hypothetical protein FC21_GL000003 [Limosilactobacillus equigenerosi DSM 18793 = JCM 14505]